MIPPPIPENEQSRLAALLASGALDNAPDEAFDDLVRMATAIGKTPIAIISFVTADRQIIKARVGLEYDSTPRDVAFCAHTIAQAQHEPMIVPDSLQDERFFDNPSVVGDPHIRFYAGMPVVDAKGHALGTICLIDRVPRQLTTQQTEMLRILARHVLIHLEARQGELQTRMHQP